MAIASPQCLECRLDPASLNYELPKEPQARAAVLAKLFLEEADCKRHMENAKRISEINMCQYDILWDMFQVAWCLSMIQRLVPTLWNQPYIQDVHIGVTESPWWRWIGCADYSAQGGNDNFLAHKERFSYMYPLLVDVKDAVFTMEEDLIDIVRRSPAAKKVRNGTKYVQGTTRSKNLFLYICVAYIDGF